MRARTDRRRYRRPLQILDLRNLAVVRNQYRLVASRHSLAIESEEDGVVIGLCDTEHPVQHGGHITEE
ncbi:hypothetical protein D3C84_936080 [compost metagenome]